MAITLPVTDHLRFPEAMAPCPDESNIGQGLRRNLGSLCAAHEFLIAVLFI